ncbi:NAD(P)H-dependent amine dehydrogenase family protein [Nakamurella endophytica]|uniref:Oxidoreductase n=1 Tax=Nakamurella endophytica TaxID=1748367 RepID=A0A917SVH4_9ACTN|nr:hypothetical protein [Nakamurella endophytica]GGL98110.1 oxidoreductase [Nakamurella endophytica]
MNNSASVPVVVVGLGALGRFFVRAAAADPRIAIVGAVDTDPAKIGRTVEQVTGESTGAGLPVAGDLATLIRQVPVRPQVLVHMTESRPDRILQPLLDGIAAGLHVLSAAESMFHPWLRYPEHARRLHEAATAAGVTVTGTGINPGFVSDQLVLDVAAASTGITGIRLSRAVEVSDTGPGDVEHVGFGLSVEEFRRRVADGHVEGHMGLPESFALLAERLDLPIERITESWEPVSVDRVTPSAIGDIAPGHVVGIVQQAHAFSGSAEVMTARLAMYYGEGFESPHDEIVLEGLHRIHLRIEPASVSILGAAIVLANTVPLLPAAPLGLVSVLDLPTRTPRSDLRYLVDGAASRPGHIVLEQVGSAPE